MKFFLFISFLTLSSIEVASAGVLKNMQNFYSKFGATSNSSKGSSYKDQSGGYITGGSLFIRNPSMSQNMMNVTPPGFRMGCGGIDIWSGGFSFISGEQLKNMMNSIVSSLPSYAMMLGIETYAPQIHNIMQQLNKMAADFNRLNINSCETAAGIVGSMWPKSDLGSQAACRMLASNNGAMSDYASTRHNCGKDPHNTLNNESNQNKDSLVGEFNLAWKVLDKMALNFDAEQTTLNPFAGTTSLSTAERQKLKEILMTISGTIIRKKNGNSFDQQTLIGKGSTEGMLTALMKGGKITYYRCDEHQKCLNPTETSESLPENEALFVKIQAILERIVEKIQNDNGQTTATEGEIALINATTLPVYKIINVTTAYQKGRAPISIGEYTDIIAFDVVFKYISDVLDSFQDATVKLRSMQFTDEHIQPFLEGIQGSRKVLLQHRQSVFAKMDTMLGFINKTKMIEQQIHHMLGNLTNEYGA